MRPGFGLDEMAYAAWALVHGVAMLRTTALRHYPSPPGSHLPEVRVPHISLRGRLSVQLAL